MEMLNSQSARLGGRAGDAQAKERDHNGRQPCPTMGWRVLSAFNHVHALHIVAVSGDLTSSPDAEPSFRSARPDKQA
jgi:hypothetical protein